MQTENFVLVYSALVFHLPHTGSVWDGGFRNWGQVCIMAFSAVSTEVFR